MDKYLSQEKLNELKEELQTLKTQKRLEVAEQLKRAKEYGDLSENSEYSEAKEEQARVESRIFELDELLKKAVVVGKADKSGKVQVGNGVKLEKGGKQIEYSIVGSNESRPEEGKISNESPIGKALLGRAVGEEVEVVTPGGKAVYKILEIN